MAAVEGGQLRDGSLNTAGYGVWDRLRSLRARFWPGRRQVTSGGRAWDIEHPSAEAGHQEENHERDRRDSEVAVGATPSFPPFC